MSAEAKFQQFNSISICIRPAEIAETKKDDGKNDIVSGKYTVIELSS